MRLTSRKRSSGAGISSQHTTLAVSWLGKSFHAAAVQRGNISATWTSPEPIEGTNNFAMLVRRAIAETNFHGGTVTLVLSHPRLVHQLVEVPPPVKGQGLEKLVARQARQQSQNLFPGEAVWSYCPAESDKTNQRLLLNLFPQPLLDDLTTGSKDAGLFLIGVIPAVAVLQSQLLELPAEGSEVVMVAAETGDATTVVVGRTDGKVLLARTLSGNWTEGAEKLGRMAVDLKRTVLFVNQQYGVPVQGVWLFGPGAEEHAAALQAQASLPVQVSPVPWTEDYWATQALRLGPNQSQNLITREQQLAPQRRVLATVVGVFTALLVLASLGVSYYLYTVLRREQATLVDLKREVATMQVRHRELQDLHQDLSRRQEVIKVVAEDRVAPVAGWMLGYLSDILPDSLVVTNLSVHQEEALWRLRISGMLQPTATNVPPGTLARAVGTFTNSLATGPFHVRFEDLKLVEKPAPKPGAPPGAIAGLVNRVTGTQPPRPAGPESLFVIEGMVKP